MTHLGICRRIKAEISLHGQQASKRSLLMSLLDRFSARIRDLGRAPPGGCINLECQSTTPTALRLRWQCPAKTDPPVTRYQVQYSPKFIGDWVDAQQSDDAAGVSTTRFTVTGLDPSTRYVVRVRLGNDVGWGPYVTFPGDLWTKAFDGSFSAPLSPMPDAPAIRRGSSASAVLPAVPSPGKIVGIRSAAVEARSRVRRLTSTPSTMATWQPQTRTAPVDPTETCGHCSHTLLVTGACLDKVSLEGDVCACPLYEAHLVDEMGTLCGRCEHTLASHRSVRSSTCLQCSMLLCSYCKRVVHDEPACADSLPVACIDTPSIAGPSPYPSDALSQSSSASGSQPRVCTNPHHITLAAPALAILKAAYVRHQATAQLDAFVASSHQSRPRRLSHASSDADSTIPAIPSTDDEHLDMRDQSRAHGLGSAVGNTEAVRLSQSYMTLAAVMSPADISSLLEKLRRTEGQYLNELALLPPDERIVPAFPSSLQLSSGVTIQAASVPLVALSSHMMQPPPSRAICIDTRHSSSSLASVSYADTLVSDSGPFPDTLPPSSRPPAQQSGNGNQMTLCPNCALSFQSPLSGNGSAADGEVLNSPPKVSSKLLPPRSPAPVVRSLRMAAPLVHATLPVEPFRGRSVSETLAIRSFSPALLSRALTSSPAMSSIADASAFQLSPPRWPHGDEPALHDDGLVEADACSSPSFQQASPMLHPPEVLLARSVSFTPRAVHAASSACVNADMTPEQLTAVIRNQFKASKSLMEFVSVLRKHRHIIKHYPLPFPKADAFSSLLRCVEPCGTTAISPDTDDASIAAGASASPETTFVPSLCQITMDLMREPGVVLTAPRSMFACVDDVEKLYGFGDPGSGNTTSTCQVFIPLASAASVSLLEQALVLVLRSMAMKRLHDIDQSEDSVAVDDYVGTCTPSIFARLSRTLAGGDGMQMAYGLFSHHDASGLRVILRHVQPNDWKSTGLSTHSFATKPMELSFHSDEDRGMLARITHADVFQIWDASQLEEECVWAMTCVTVTHTVACPVYPSRDRTPMFRLPALSTDSSDHSSLGHDLMLPPLAGVIDIERYLDMDGVGKRPGEIRVQLLEARNLILAKHVNRVYCIARLGRREVQGMYHICKAVTSAGLPWKEGFTFPWDGMDVLVLSLWSLRFETGPSVEECVGHVEISLFRLAAGVPLRETFIVRKQDETGVRIVTGEVDVELYYSHINTVPMKRRKVARRQSSY